VDGIYHISYVEVIGHDHSSIVSAYGWSQFSKQEKIDKSNAIS
jgi:hypothetical protein